MVKDLEGKPYEEWLRTVQPGEECGESSLQSTTSSQGNGGAGNLFSGDQ